MWLWAGNSLHIGNSLELQLNVNPLRLLMSPSPGMERQGPTDTKETLESCSRREKGKMVMGGSSLRETGRTYEVGKSLEMCVIIGPETRKCDCFCCICAFSD